MSGTSSQAPKLVAIQYDLQPVTFSLCKLLLKKNNDTHGLHCVDKWSRESSTQTAIDHELVRPESTHVYNLCYGPLAE